MCTQNCASMCRKSSFFMVSENISTNRTTGISQYYGSLMKKVQMNYCILVKKEWYKIKMTKSQ